MTDVPAPSRPAITAANRVGAAAVVWSSAILLSRVIGLVRDAVLGRTLGVSAEGDVYYQAFVIPDFVNYLLAGGILSLTFIPIFSRHLHAGDERRGWDAFSTIANFLVLVALPLTLLVAYATPWIVPHIAGGFAASQQALLARLTRIILPAQVFLMLGALLAGTLQARNRHAVAAFAPSSYTVGIIVVGLALYQRLGAEAFAWGVLAGAAFGAFAIPLVACMSGGMRWTPRLDLRNPDFRTYLGLALPVMLGQSIVALDSWLWKWQGTYAGTGAVSTLNYAKTLLNVPAGLFGMAAGAAAYPTLVRLHHEGKHAESYALLTRTAKTTLLLAFLSQALLSVAGEDAVRLVWGFSSRKFTDADVAGIAQCLSLFALSLGAWSLHPLIARGFYARGNTWLPTVLGTGITVLVVPLYVVARHVGGTAGLALASSVALIVYVVPLHFALRRIVAKDAGGSAGLPPWSGFLVRSVATLAVTCGTLFALRLASLVALPGSDPVSALARLAIVGAAAIPLFLAAARIFRVDEARALSERVASAARKAAARVLRRD
jgi:putative peptidoglycan lipid II flippase